MVSECRTSGEDVTLNKSSGTDIRLCH